MHKNSKTHWIELRMTNGKLAGKFDPVNDLLEVKIRNETKVFDLAKIRDDFRSGETFQINLNQENPNE